MAYSPAKIRIIGRDCMAKYDAGQGTIQDIVNGLGMSQENTDLVLAWIYTQRPELDLNYVAPDAEEVEAKKENTETE